MITSKLPEFIYQGNSVPEIIRLYNSELLKGDSFQDISHAMALKAYHAQITDRKFLTLLRRDYEGLCQTIIKLFPQLKFSMGGRCKSLISTEEKLCKLLSEKQSLDLFRDSYAFRIVLFGDEANSLQLINNCYEIMNLVIRYYVSKGYILCEEDPVVDTMDHSSPLYQELLIPKKSGISDTYLYGVKDYIIHPKANGYQSLHCVFRTSTGYCFEIQVRTFGMHTYAVDGRAEHSKYKNAKYRKRITIDRDRVHIPGYGISSNGNVMDLIGLEQPLIIFHRQKTF